MEVRYSVNPKDVKRFTTDELRDEFLIQGLFQTEIQLVYSHVDRMIQGSVAPTSPRELKVKVGENMGVSYFLERRELGVINIGGSGKVSVDGTVYDLARTDGLYVGMGAKKVVFSSACNLTKRDFRKCNNIAAELWTDIITHLGSCQKSRDACYVQCFLISLRDF